MIVISDTAPIIFFAIIEKLSILKELYSSIFVPNTTFLKKSLEGVITLCKFFLI